MRHPPRLHHRTIRRKCQPRTEGAAHLIPRPTSHPVHLNALVLQQLPHDLAQTLATPFTVQRLQVPPKAKTPPRSIGEQHWGEGQDVQVAMRLLPLITRMVDPQGEGSALHIGRPVRVILGSLADSRGFQPQLAMRFMQDGINIRPAIQAPILNGMTDLGRCRAEHLIHGLRNCDAVRQQTLAPAVHPQLEIPDQRRGDLAIHHFLGGQPNLEPGRRIQEANLDLVFPGQVAIHIADGVATLCGPPQMLFDIPRHRVGGPGGGNPRVREVTNQGIHQVPILANRSAMTSPGQYPGLSMPSLAASAAPRTPKSIHPECQAPARQAWHPGRNWTMELPGRPFARPLARPVGRIRQLDQRPLHLGAPMEDEQGEHTLRLDTLALGPGDQGFPAFQGHTPQVDHEAAAPSPRLQAKGFLVEARRFEIHNFLRDLLSWVIMAPS